MYEHNSLVGISIVASALPTQPQWLVQHALMLSPSLSVDLATHMFTIEQTGKCITASANNSQGCRSWYCNVGSATAMSVDACSVTA